MPNRTNLTKLQKVILATPQLLAAFTVAFVVACIALELVRHH